jgi:8-oxo-dGTP pyrophosphatase MutT (NUDIX family)
MTFAIKIYYNDKPIIITTDREAYVNAHPNAAGYMHYYDAENAVYSMARQKLEDPEVAGVLIEGADSQKMLAGLTSVFEMIEAGGGVVFNQHQQVLIIFRRGKWDLPKGKRDDGESIEDCAVREVIEETGITDLSIGEHIGDTYHLYRLQGKLMIKHSIWFRMVTTSDAPLLPQAEEDILEAKWVNPADLPTYLENTYTAIRDVLVMAQVL